MSISCFGKVIPWTFRARLDKLHRFGGLLRLADIASEFDKAARARHEMGQQYLAVQACPGGGKSPAHHTQTLPRQHCCCHWGSLGSPQAQGR